MYWISAIIGEKCTGSVFFSDTLCKIGFSGFGLVFEIGLVAGVPPRY